MIELFRDCLNGYAYQSLSEVEHKRWESAFDEGDEEAYTALFGPDKIPGEIGQFLDWFVVRKVMAGEEFLRACGTVTKKLGKWLEANGYLDGGDAAYMVERGAEAGTDLPKADKLAGLLFEQSRETPRFDPNAMADDDWIEDQLWIERVEPGELWFDGGIGPVPVTPEASRLAHEGWAVTITLARLAGRWRIVAVGNVYP